VICRHGSKAVGSCRLSVVSLSVCQFVSLSVEALWSSLALVNTFARTALVFF
jgi:hypothetical protein